MMTDLHLSAQLQIIQYPTTLPSAIIPLLPSKLPANR